jgi:hypothetical protein
MNSSESPGADAVPRRRRFRLRSRLALSAIGLAVAAHLFVLYKISAHVTLSAELLAWAAIVLLVKHLGLFGSAYTLYRRRLRRKQLQ